MGGGVDGGIGVGIGVDIGAVGGSGAAVDVGRGLGPMEGDACRIVGCGVAAELGSGVPEVGWARLGTIEQAMPIVANAAMHATNFTAQGVRGISLIVRDYALPLVG